MKKRVAIVHFQPVEMYPPVLNLLRCMDGDNDLTVRVYTMQTDLDKNRVAYKTIAFKRFAKRFQLFFGTFFRFIFFRPQVIIYYETESSWPVYWYRKLANFKLFIHYHEYNDPQWYKNAGKLLTILHRREVAYLYQKAEWISQTNEKRLALFLNDNNIILHPPVHHALPNYPPSNWSASDSLASESLGTGLPAKIKLAYVGVLSLEGSYLEPLVQWISRHQEQVSLTIFSYNIQPDARAFLQKQNLKAITVVDGGIDYYNLPSVLAPFDYGLILYKTLSTNYEFNVPNKFYEYLSSGLGVIFPANMPMMEPYMKDFPPGGIVKADYNQLDQEILDKLLRFKQSGAVIKSEFHCENVYQKLIDRVKSV